MEINIILFSDFETLDVFGPVEIFGKVSDWTIKFYSQSGGLIANKDGIKIETKSIDSIINKDIEVLFIPGGLGVRSEILNIDFINQIEELAKKSRYVLTVCTGSALLAKTGLLDGRKATSNKRSFDWVKTSSAEVKWMGKARWIVDEKYYTSSGISAGIDMSLGFVCDLLGEDIADQIAFRIEYHWVKDNEDDDFCKQ